MKKLLFLFSLFLLVMLSSCNNSSYDIVVTNYVGYDAAKAVTKDTGYTIKMLLKPGSDIHSYEPSATDIRSVLNAKIFIYVGGESDSEWVESDILGNVKNKDIKIISMFDVLENRLILEEGEEDEYDEHVWTNPDNHVLVTKAIRDELVKIDSNNKDKFLSNTQEYVDSIIKLSTKMFSTIESKNINTIVVADRNPFMYFGKYFNLNIVGALKGCSEDKSVPSSKIIELKNAVEYNNLKAIFKIELSDGGIAESVKTEIDNDIKNGKYSGSNVTIETLYSMQNISSDDFNYGLTYIDFFNKNIDVIEKL